MSKPNRARPAWNFVHLLVTGVGVGWLVGLSVSPVVQTVVSSIIGVAVAVVAFLSGIDYHPGESTGPSAADGETKLTIRRPIHANTAPMLALVVGLVLGTPVGVLVRTNALLGADPGIFSYKLGKRLSRDLIAARILNLYLPPISSETVTHDGTSPKPASIEAAKPASSEPGKVVNVLGAGLNAAEFSTGGEIRSRLMELGEKDARIRSVLEKCNDDELSVVKEALCGKRF